MATNWDTVKKGTPISVSNNRSAWTRGLYAGTDGIIIFTFPDGETWWLANENGLVPWRFAKLDESGDDK